MNGFYDLPEYVRTPLLLAAAALWFFLLAMVVKGPRRALEDGIAARSELFANFVMWGLDAVILSPLLVIGVNLGLDGLAAYGVSLPSPVWPHLGPIPTIVLCIIAADFVGYWRHRLEHAPWFWPAHAVHHSDRHMTWMTLERMHPVDRLITSTDVLILAMLGFPVWAIGANVLVRHYYGYLLHADVPWTLGKFELVFNSPAMHRWHHSRDVRTSSTNFATIFSVWDRLFGTLHAPGPCDAPLGVEEDMGQGVVGQYLHPFRVWLGLNRPQEPSVPAPAPVRIQVDVAAAKAITPAV